MRIQEIRFKNLNSLEGEWVIDLTHPEYTSNGIFAITGPTGSGKTTILDAICLALYGRTPRLQKVTKSGNEIMSRLTGECFAEVTFETQRGCFRSHWSQHRARRKAGGELQSPRRELSDASSGKIIETRITKVEKSIIEVTGMDFNQFTRSMLLAQGGFAAFLQASVDERAPILEQITGTAIYATISKRVHELRLIEENKLLQLKTALEGMQFLTSEQEQEYREKLAQLEKKERELSLQLESKKQAVLWVRGLDRLKSELTSLHRVKEEFTVQFNAFAPQLKRLERAEKALELHAEHTSLTTLRKRSAEEMQALEEHRTQRPIKKAMLEQAEKATTEKKATMEEKKEELRRLAPVFQKTRELDVTLTERDKRIEEMKTICAESEAQCKSYVAEKESLSGKLSDRTHSLKDLEKKLKEIEADKPLVEELTGLRSRFDAVKASSKHIQEKEKETKEATDQLRRTTIALERKEKKLGSLKERRAAIQKKVLDTEDELKSVLRGSDMSAWFEKKMHCSKDIQLVDETMKTLNRCMELREEKEKMEARGKAHEMEQGSLNKEIEHLQEKLPLGQQAIEKLDKELLLLNRIKDLEEARHQLRDGKPCPLCGSTQHPYAGQELPTPNETEIALKKKKEEVKKLTNSLSEKKEKLAGISKDIENIQSGIERNRVQMAEQARTIDGNCEKLGVVVAEEKDEQALFAALEAHKERQQMNQNEADEVLKNADRLEKRLKSLGKSLDEAKEKVIKMEGDVRELKQVKKIARQTIQRLESEREKLVHDQQEMLRALSEETAKFGGLELTPATLERTYEDLKKRRDRWVRLNERERSLKEEVKSLEQRVSNLRQTIERATKDHEKLVEKLKAGENERKQLTQQRWDLFGDKEVDREEQRFKQELEAAEEAHQAARKQHMRLSQELKHIDEAMQQLEKDVEKRKEELRTTEQAFLEKCKVLGFEDEQDYLSAGIPSAERVQLNQQAQEWNKRKTEIETQINDNEKRLQIELQKKVTDESLNTLNEAIRLLEDKQTQLQHEVGAIKGKLEENEKLKRERMQKVKEFEAQQREYAKWSRLHHYIGSSDGKKFRNFAQGLTFEIMVRQANQQLQKMSDRYLLIHQGDSPLELQIIDNYQAGEIRSTKNLSGGESFIVSLSLALGLSKMASRNVQVDSLFLDEGFGYLDEEAMDIALETLAGLQQHGKLIGIISHVQALKERIRTQVQVSRKAGGRSEIIGPGCRRVA